MKAGSIKRWDALKEHLYLALCMEQTGRYHWVCFCKQNNFKMTYYRTGATRETQKASFALLLL